MTAETDLLPLVGTLKALPEHVQGVVQAYAIANVAHATAALQAEVEALRAERDAQQAEIERLITKIYEAMSALAEQPKVKPTRTVTYVCPVCAASLERQE